MLTDLFLLLLILCPFEGRSMNLTESMIPSHDNIPQNNVQISSNWSFMAVIVYGERVLCAGTAFNVKWAITLAHCVHGNLREENLERFGSMSVRLGAAPISYKKIKEVEIKISEVDEDDEYYIPVVDVDKLLPVYSVVVHPEYIYKENFQINTSLAFVGVNDLALVKFKKGPTFSLPSLHLYSDFSGWCVAAGLDLSMSKVPLVKKIYEFQLYVGDKKQCQPYLNVSAEKIPYHLKEGYKMNKICSLYSGDVYFHGIEDADGGSPLICNNRLQGILSHYYKKSNGEYFYFFYDLTQFGTWIRKQIFEVEDFEINRKGNERSTTPTTTTTSPTTTTTTTIETTTTSSTTIVTTPTTTTKTTTIGTHGTARFITWIRKQLFELRSLEISRMGNGKSISPTTVTTSPTTTIKTMTTSSTTIITTPTTTTKTTNTGTYGTAPNFRWANESDWIFGFDLNTTPAT